MSTSSPDAAPETPEQEFEARVNETLHLACVLARKLIGAHQAAMGLIVGGDWGHARKYFSLSDKYAAWEDFTPPAKGLGLHGLVVSENQAIRLTEAEVEAHPDYRGFSEWGETHPPMRGWLAVPLVGEDGRNYGLLQLSDKVDGSDFTEEDERLLEELADLAELSLDALSK